MSKDILKSASPVDEGPDLVVPSVTTQRDKWNRGNIAYALAAKDSDGALGRFCQEHCEIEIAICERESLDQETGESISEDDAVALATRIKNLHLSLSFDGPADYVVFLAGQCLKLKEGKSVGDVCTAFASLERANPPPSFPEWRGTWQTIKLAVPAGLTSAFGVQSSVWLGSRCEDFARDYERKGFPPGFPSSRLFDGGSFGFSLDPASRSSQPEPDSIPVVPAPDEATTSEYVKRAPSSADHWNTLVKVAAILREHQQPFGGALSEWLIEAAKLEVKRPRRSTAVKWPANALRNHAIIEAVRALERCGIRATRNRDENWIARAHGWEGKRDPDYNPPLSGCALVASAFGITERAAISAWDSRTTAM